MNAIEWASISEFVGSMIKKVPLPAGLRPKSPYAALDDFDVGQLCLQSSALPKAILSLNTKTNKVQQPLVINKLTSPSISANLFTLAIK